MRFTVWRDDIRRNMNPFQFLLFASRPYRIAMIASIFSVAIAATLNVGSSYVFKMLINAATTLATNGSANALWHAATAYIAISTGSILAWRASGFIGMHWTAGVRMTTRYALSSYATLHSHNYFSNRFAGSISSKIASASNSTKEMSEQILWQFTAFVVTMITSFFVTLSANQTLAFVFLGWIAVITPLNIYFARRRTPLSAATQKAETALGGNTVDMLTNISTVHEYASRSFELNLLKQLQLTRREVGLRNFRYGETVLLINGLLQTLFISALLLLAIHYTLVGIISPGDIALILTLIILVEDRLAFIGSQLNNFADAWGQVSESLQDILEIHDVPNTKTAQPLSTDSGSVVFENVTFTYGGTSIFDKFSLAIPNGQKVGLVGRSGAGKSTLIKLILRHYDLMDGKILIEGTPITDVTKESLRKHIAVVPQEPILFHRTIRENIAYGIPHPNEEDVTRAATLAKAHEFIMQLPQKYDSLVGERGIKLSGGQRQRIAIARAIFKNSPILLLDEATSSLDSESEAAVQEALLTLMKHRTVIAIAHRLSTLRVMDRIIVMDGGKIVEDGTHAELIALNGLYANLWSRQAGGFLTTE